MSVLAHQQINKVGSIQVEVGDVVLVGCGNKGLDWPMGLVVEVLPGKDDSVRVAKEKNLYGRIDSPVFSST